MKKIIALCVSSLFVFSLGIDAFAEETERNPWDRNVQTTAKKGEKTGAKAVKTNKKETEKVKRENAKKMSLAKAEKTSVEKAENKESGQKKKFLFW